MKRTVSELAELLAATPLEIQSAADRLRINNREGEALPQSSCCVIASQIAQDRMTAFKPGMLKLSIPDFFTVMVDACRTFNPRRFQ